MCPPNHGLHEILCVNVMSSICLFDSDDEDNCFLGSNMRGRCDFKVFLPNLVLVIKMRTYFHINMQSGDTCGLCLLSVLGFYGNTNLKPRLWHLALLIRPIHCHPLKSRTQAARSELFPCDFPSTGLIYTRATLLPIHLWKDLSCCCLLCFLLSAKVFECPFEGTTVHLLF